MTEKFVHYLGGTIKISNQPPYGASVSILLPDECVISSIEPDNSYYELKNS
jgi:signal transduction histidine kinase